MALNEVDCKVHQTKNGTKRIEEKWEKGLSAERTLLYDNL